MRFQYQPLNPDEIRLLKPLSTSSDSLSFKLVHVSLLSKPRYAALSYTWGLPGDFDGILLNGQPFPIRQNLYNALQQVQSSKLVDQYLWVDAICINQGENNGALNERSFQITLMTQIYEQAAKILVWLGKPENETNNRLAFPMMKDFEKRFRHGMKKAHLHRPCLWQHKPRTLGEDLADFMLTISPAKDKKVFDVPGSATYNAWLGIISLWKSPWWTRTWVFQEATIQESSKTGLIEAVSVLPFLSKVRFLCGDQETSWPELNAANAVVSSIVTTPGINSQFLVDTQRSFSRLSLFRSLRVMHALPSFLDILQMFRHTECLDPRDKVYAPLCLAPDDVCRYIRPDYARKTVLDVYTDVVRYYLAQPGHDLDFLGHALYQEEAQAVETPQGIKSALPSWVPNFSASLHIHPIPKILHVPRNLDMKGLPFHDEHGVPSNETLIAAYHPLGDTPSRSFIKNNMLCASGVYVDVLKDIVPNTGPDLKAMLAVGREKGRQWAIESKHKYFTGESFGDAINRTLVLDVVFDDLGRPSERGGKLDSAFLCRPHSELSIEEYWFQLKMKSAQLKASTSRDLAMSQKLYLLMIANSARVGDEIWALAGGQALYILRPVNRVINQFLFIGECYTHGLMDGDIVRRLHLGEVQMEDISLL